ncbi:MAG: tetratricopeptide repeat protein [Acidobacteriota bacterium]
MKGRFLVNEPARQSIELGIQTLEQVVRKDPTHGPAYASMAQGWNALSSVFLPPSVAMPNAKTAARKAVELQPDSDSAHAALGLTLLWYDWNWAGSAEQFEKALSLNPNSAESHRGLACLRLTLGQREQSIQAANRAADLAPRALFINLFSVFTLYLNQREDDAIRLARATLEWEPKFGLARTFLGMAYLDRGHSDEAIRELELAARDQRIPMTIAFLSMGYARVGRTREARALLAEVVALSRTQYVCPFEVAVAFASLGEKDEAFAWMRRGIAERADCMVHLRSEPWVAPLRSDPRYAALIKEVGFPPDAPPAVAR